MPRVTRKTDPRKKAPVRVVKTGLRPGERAVTADQKAQRLAEKTNRNRKSADESRKRKRKADEVNAAKLARYEVNVPRLIDALLWRNAEFNRLHLLTNNQFRDQFEGDDAAINRLVADARGANDETPSTGEQDASAEGGQSLSEAVGQSSSARGKQPSRSISPYESTSVAAPFVNLISLNQGNIRKLNNYSGTPSSARLLHFGSASGTLAAGESSYPAHGSQGLYDMNDLPTGYANPCGPSAMLSNTSYPVPSDPFGILPDRGTIPGPATLQAPFLDGMLFINGQTLDQSFPTPPEHMSNGMQGTAPFKSTIDPAPLGMAMNSDYAATLRPGSSGTLMLPTPESLDFSAGALAGDMTMDEARQLARMNEPLVPSYMSRQMGGVEQSFYDFPVIPPAPVGENTYGLNHALRLC